MNIIKSQECLKFTGKDALSFVDSLISNTVKTDKLFFSYLLAPDGKIINWFICETINNEFYIYQEAENLKNLHQIFNKYKIRIKCELEVINKEKIFSLEISNDSISINEIFESSQITSWTDFELIAELPSKKILENGLIPNEVSWLDSFVDYDKGCFMGQEQTSRIKFRGRPRRLLKTVSDRTQVLEKI
jgi:folate-binding protein YgfZ|tara:strand:+ start:2526 stop:3092 length:567 start_codon:yes stop_codon:yes gene_type:complete